MPYTPITSLPTAPDRTQPSTFSTRADALVAALSTFVTETNAAGTYIDGVGTEVDADATAAATSAAEAAASATAAASEASAWVSGASYAVGDVVWSSVDYGTYRAKTTHSGETTDPSSDTTNWALVVANDLAAFGITASAAELNTLDGFAGSTDNLNATQYLSGRNLIINGSGRINQRSYTSGTATSGANGYTLDRWRVVTSGQNLTFTGTDAGRTMTAPASGVEQEIEGANIVGGTYTISFTGTATCTVDGVTKTSGDTVTLTANTNSTVRFTSGTFTDVQLEPGNVATPFEMRSIGEELALCQRYYLSGTIYGWSYAGGAVAVRASLERFGITMRVTPSIAFSAVNYENCSNIFVDGSPQLRGFGVKVDASAIGTITVNAAYTADAEL